MTRWAALAKDKIAFSLSSSSLDSMGNRTSNASYNALNENSAESSDSNGDTTKLPIDGSATATIKYDAWGRVVSTATVSTDQVSSYTNTYTYNALGQRVTANQGSSHTPTLTVYDIGNNPIAEYNASGAVATRYIWSAAGVSRLILRDTLGGSPVSVTRVYLLTDRDNSTTTVVGDPTPGSWGTEEHYDYTPDGNTAAYNWNWSSGAGNSTIGAYTSAIGMDFRWHGERYIQLYYSGESFSTSLGEGGADVEHMNFGGGLYVTAYGAGFYDPQHERLLAPSANVPTQNPYNAHVT